MTSAPDHTNGTYFLSKLPCGRRIGSTIFKMNLFVVNYGNIRELKAHSHSVRITRRKAVTLLLKIFLFRK